MKQDWSLRACHIQGRSNVIADHLTSAGQMLPTEWSLKQEVLDLLFSRWGTPHVDLFATRYNRKLPLFVSPVPDPEALDVDALSISWEGTNAYAFPSQSILAPVLRKRQKPKTARLILIAPMNQSSSWFPLRQQEIVEELVQLPLSRTLLKQPHSPVFHSNPQCLYLHTWLLEKPC